MLITAGSNLEKASSYKFFLEACGLKLINTLSIYALTKTNSAFINRTKLTNFMVFLRKLYVWFTILSYTNWYYSTNSSTNFDCNFTSR